MVVGYSQTGRPSPHDQPRQSLEEAWIAFTCIPVGARTLAGTPS